MNNYNYRTNSFKSAEGKTNGFSFTGLRSRRNRRLLDSILMIYMAICTLWFSLETIVFFSEKAAGSPLKFFPSWLRAVGIVLILAEVLMVSPRRRGPLRFLLYGICLSAFIASLIHIKYGFINNFRTILMMLICFALFYGASYSIPEKRLRSFLRILYALLAILWFVACCLSLVQFALQIGSDGPNHATVFWLRGTGFANQRLTGVFGFPEYGGVTGVMLIIIGALFFVKYKNLPLRILLVILNLPVYIYLVLCGSRNAALAFFLAVSCGTLLLTRKYFPGTAAKGRLFCLVLSLLVLIASLGLYTATKRAAEFLPPIIGIKTEEETGAATNEKKIATERAVSGKDKAESAATAAGAGIPEAPLSAVRMADSNKVPMIINGISVGNVRKKSEVDNKEKATEEESEDLAETTDTGLLKRTYRDGDITTGRLKIWRNYRRLWKEIGIFGLSPENTGYYVQEHHPKMYIVTTPEKATPWAAAQGYVFHPHNGYIKVYASAGFLGLFLMLGFFLGAAVRTVRYILNQRTLSLEFIFTLLVLIAGASSAIFDLELFFTFNPPTFFFWLGMSFLFRLTTSPFHRADPKMHR